MIQNHRPIKTLRLISCFNENGSWIFRRNMNLVLFAQKMTFKTKLLWVSDPLIQFLLDGVQDLGVKPDESGSNRTGVIVETNSDLDSFKKQILLRDSLKKR